MKVSLNWLRELCATDLPEDELARRLTFGGFEVEGRERRRLGPPGDVVAARIVTAFFARRQKTTRQYFLGGRSVPWWAISASIVATETSTITFISVPGIAYSARGWNG